MYFFHEFYACKLLAYVRKKSDEIEYCASGGQGVSKK